MFDPPSAAAPMLPLQPESGVTPPPGLLGEIAKFIYDAAPRPVPEIAIAGAIGFLAGVAGRAYNIGGAGLNQYVLALAKTGSGKDAIASGISKLIAALSDPASDHAKMPHAASFVGPADMASGPALLKAVARKNPPSFVSIIGEFGLRFKQMADTRAQSADTSLLRVLLDLYSKSGHGQIVGELVYSNKDNNTDLIVAPALSLIGESTPETFYGYLNENMIANGLLPRFTIIEYDGDRARRNRNAANVQPDPAMMDRLAALMAASFAANAVNRATEVLLMPDAEAYLDELDEYADDQINNARHNTGRELWNRAHLKAAKLAGLIAVGCNHEQPIVTLEMATWARQQIERDIRRLLDRFETGEVGEDGGNELKQQNEVLRCIFEYLTEPYERFASYGTKKEMREKGVFTQSYLSRRLLKLPTFRDDRNGATIALKRVLTSLLEAGEIVEMPKRQVDELFGSAARAFMAADFDRLLELGRKIRK
jgi:hypothetical protein